MNLAAFNLNQLTSLHALLQEQSVGRAATLVGVTQSAMSHTLRTLRESFDDPLLVRVGNRMVLTPFAEGIRERLERGLGELELVLAGRAGFDPATVDTTFTLAADDGTASTLTPFLFAELGAQAPRARLRIRPLDAARLPRQLEDGQVDLAMVPNLIDLPNTVGEPAGAEGSPLTAMSVISRKEHPQIGKRLTLPRYCSLRHVMLSLSGEGPSFIDHLLAEQGRSREVAVRLPYLVALVETITRSDLIATVVTPLAQFFCERWPVQMHPVPLPISLDVMELRWHPRFEADPAHRFFRELVRRANAEAVARCSRRSVQ